MKENKICFIACVNNEKYWQECQLYLSRIIVPDGYEVDVIAIEGAPSMCAGYNEGMNATDAKYKIYLHQDVFIVDPYFLIELMNIFESDKKIGMIGMAGSLQMPKDAVVWNGPRVVSIYRAGNDNIGALSSLPSDMTCLENKLKDVVAIDGLLIATGTDIPWREDLFNGWDFYDMSQSQEFLRAGYRVVVPDFNRPFCVHDDGMVLNLINYDKYRKIFLREYVEG